MTETRNISTASVETGSSNAVKETPKSAPASAVVGVNEMSDIVAEVLRMTELPTNEQSVTAGSAGAQTQGDDGKAKSAYTLALEKTLPREEIMRSKVQYSFEKKAAELKSKAYGLSWYVTKGKASELNDIVANIRKIEAILAYIIFASYEYIKKLYIQIFQPKLNIR